MTHDELEKVTGERLEELHDARWRHAEWIRGVEWQCNHATVIHTVWLLVLSVAIAAVAIAGCGPAPASFDVCASRDYDGKEVFRMEVQTYVQPATGYVTITATDSEGRDVMERTVPAGHGVRWAQTNPPVMRVRAVHGADVREVALPWPASHGERVRVCSGDGWWTR